MHTLPKIQLKIDSTAITSSGLRMRFFLFLSLAFILGITSPGFSQTLLKNPLATAATAPAAAPKASTIIPGSPLAALTGAAPSASPNADNDSPAPFGTDAIGFPLAETISTEATRSAGYFISAIRQSIKLEPTLDWLRGFATTPQRRHDLAAILSALGIAILPALAVEGAVWLGLTRPRAYLARRAAQPGQGEHREPEQGIADAEAGETEKRPRRRLSFLLWARRVLIATLHLGLSLVPLIGFMLTIGVIATSGVLTTRPAHLAVVAVVNGYLCCRLAIEFARFLVAPSAPGMRLIHMPSVRAVRILNWCYLLLATGLLGFVIISGAQVLGLAHAAAVPVIHLVAFVVHIELAILVWKSRKLVGSWIGGPADAKGSFAALRRQLGQLWYIPALFYIVALWSALAAGIHNAFGVLLRIVVVVALAIIFGRLAWAGSSALLERAFPSPSTTHSRHAAIFVRAHAYNPLIRILIRILIGILVVVLILQGWGIHAVDWLLTNALSRSLIGAFIAIVITIVVALILWETSNAVLDGRIDRLSASGKTRQASRLRTLLPMLKASIGGVLSLITGLICLSKIGVNAAPLLAGAGVLGIAIGFGSQKLVQDIITGLFLLLEDAVQVGDVISVASMSGTVERLSIRTIRLRGGDGSINIIPFSAVTTVTNMTRDFGYAQISIQVAYEEDLPRVYAVLTDIARTMRKESAWGAMIRDDLQLFGLDQFGASALVVTGQIRTGPGQQASVRREFYARVKTRFEAEHIEMPYTYLPPAPPRVEAPGPEAGDENSGQNKAIPPL
jgi:small-conductance mechanosensitive channel